MTVLRMAFGRALVAALGAALIVAPAALSAQDDERRRAVGDWLVEDVADDEGRRTLSMTRDADEYSVDYHLVLAPDAAAFDSQGFLVWRLNCGQSGEESLDGGLAALQPGDVRDRLAGYLARCETPGREAEALLDNFDRAFAQLTDWARDREYQASVATVVDDTAANAAERALNEAEEAIEAAEKDPPSLG